MSDGIYPGVLVPRLGGPVLYGQQFTMATQDRVIFGFITCFLILAISFLLPYVSCWRYQKRKEAIQYVGVFLSLFIWLVIMICNYGKEWLSGYVVTTTQYSPGNPNQIQARVGLHMGLRGFNVTLLGMPVNQINQTIDYNEQYSWEWQQGLNTGFGPFGGRLQNDYHSSVVRGLPYPILWVAEWFTLEGESIHWGRFMRVGGYYTHILLWIALVCWALTNVMFLMNVKYGGIGLIITGTVMILGNIVYSGLWNANLRKLVIAFPDGNLMLSYGWSYYLNLFTGLFLCLLPGIAVVVYVLIPKKSDPFFSQNIALVSKPKVEDDSEPENKEEMADVEKPSESSSTMMMKEEMKSESEAESEVEAEEKQ